VAAVPLQRWWMYGCTWHTGSIRSDSGLQHHKQCLFVQAALVCAGLWMHTCIRIWSLVPNLHVTVNSGGNICLLESSHREVRQWLQSGQGLVGIDVTFMADVHSTACPTGHVHSAMFVTRYNMF
jgi:hypothetical protein